MLILSVLFFGNSTLPSPDSGIINTLQKNKGALIVAGTVAALSAVGYFLYMKFKKDIALFFAARKATHANRDLKEAKEHARDAAKEYIQAKKESAAIKKELAKEHFKQAKQKLVDFKNNIVAAFKQWKSAV